MNFVGYKGHKIVLKACNKLLYSIDSATVSASEAELLRGILQFTKTRSFGPLSCSLLSFVRSYIETTRRGQGSSQEPSSSSRAGFATR